MKIEWPTQYGQDLIFTSVKIEELLHKNRSRGGRDKKTFTKITLNYVLKC